jgi:hypothetical protein
MLLRARTFGSAFASGRGRALAVLAATAGLFGVWAVALAGQASAATLTVCPSGPPACTYSHIQDAINAASSGDTITIAAGTYTEHLTIGGKNLSLTGAGAANTTIDGQNTDRVVLINPGTQVSISGVTITRGTSSTGGGINNFGTLTLNNSTVTNNTAGNGGGIANSGGTVTLNGSTVSHNTADGAGGGIYNTGTMTVNNSTVSDNTGNNGRSVGVGGGIANIGGGKLTLNNSTVSGNTVFVQTGGGIYNTGTLTINNSKVIGNRAGSGAGGIAVSGGTLTLNNSTVQCNTPTDIVGPFTQNHSTVGGPC